MAILLILILTNLFAMSISALPTITIPDSMWDVQRSTNYKAIHEASMLKLAEITKHTAELTVEETECTPSGPAKMIKKRAARAIKVTQVPEMKSVPMPGMQCAVM